MELSIAAVSRDLEQHWGAKWPSELEPLLSWLPKDNRGVMRIEMRSATQGRLDTLDMLAKGPVGERYTLGDEPLWVTDRVLALSIMPVPPPPLFVDDVGVRISQNVFWIITPKGDE